MKQFKAESQRLLELMINSIYTNKEIFLRELISNASDAIDKRHFLALTDNEANADFAINIAVDKDTRSIVIKDNGIGMDADELETNLGTIASSGTFKYKQEMKASDEQLIGQFGVGFYSAFMVADRVSVISRKYGTQSAFEWTSDGVGGYDIAPATRDEVGTTITLHIKPHDEDYDYDGLLEEYRLSDLVRKYSDYIRYPILMEMPRSRKKENSDEYETVKEQTTLNSMEPIWRKAKGQVTDEQYKEFYKSRFYDFTDPLSVITARVDGNISYTALLFIPGKMPYGLYTTDYKRGLALYSGGVLIMENCSELLDEHFAFVKGVIDCPDVSLNISREMLQKDRQLQALASGINKKILNELTGLMKTDRETYDKIFELYGASIKYGVYNGYGARADELKGLIEFYSSRENKFVSLAEYRERMPEGQEAIYYACGKSAQAISHLPSMDAFASRGYEVLFLTDHIDEFVMKILGEFDGKKLINIADKDALKTSDKTQSDNAVSEHQPLIDRIKQTLGDKVDDVRLSDKLVDHPVCLTADGEISLEMERVFAAMKQNNVKAKRVLEINAAHPIVIKLANSTDEKFDALLLVLYYQALMLAGLDVDAADFADNINKLI